ncbi:TPA: glycosyltransferase, partial [Klebsiella pneumoniae]|nr:glycosyltransferase [Klebsiella pneumoniae]
MTKLSIITVAYNNRAGIEQTFNSLDYIDDKDMPSIEWVVIDGGSTDGTYDYLCTLKSKIAIKYLSEKDQGIYDAMNKGILMSSGDYALFLNSGDTLVPKANEIIHEL